MTPDSDVETPSGRPSDALPSFSDPGLLDALESNPLKRINELAFGLVAMGRDGEVIAYNADQSRRSGLDSHRVLGRNFFVEVGPCANNYLVAERYRQSEELDEELDYMFAFRLAPTPVRLRLLARAGSRRQYLAVRSR